MNIRLRRRRARTHASQSPPVAPGTTGRRKAAEDSLTREIARTVPSDTEIDTAAEITQDDIDRAVNAWDDAQTAEGTGLEGLLDARFDDE